MMATDRERLTHTKPRDLVSRQRRSALARDIVEFVCSTVEDQLITDLGLESELLRSWQHLAIVSGFGGSPVGLG